MANCKVIFFLLCICSAIHSRTHRRNISQGVRQTRQVLPPAGGLDFSAGVIDPVSGQKCVTKSDEIESVSKDPILTCVHKNVDKCHYTYITQFSPAQEKVCRHNYQKTCQISFNKRFVNETVRKCYKPVDKVCDGRGEEECRTVYESSCSTKYVEKLPGEYVGETACQKLPVEICGAGCDYQEGAEECHEKVITSVVEVPEEVCDLNPQKICKFVTKLVPHLKPTEKCTSIPQEICSFKLSAPRQVKKPLRTKWCLDDAPLTKELSNSIDSQNEITKTLLADSEPKTFTTVDNSVDVIAQQAIDEKINSHDEGGIEVEEVRTSIETKFPKKRLNIPVPKFVKPGQIPNVDPHQLKSDKLSEQEKEDLENFNLGIHLENFRPNVDNRFQTQDFAKFIDF